MQSRNQARIVLGLGLEFIDQFLGQVRLGLSNGLVWRWLEWLVLLLLRQGGRDVGSVRRRRSAVLFLDPVLPGTRIRLRFPTIHWASPG